KKKASRACLHCQRAHLTCDDSRPCQRCIKRDLASTCTDAARKRAKYLSDIYSPQETLNEAILTSIGKLPPLSLLSPAYLNIYIYIFNFNYRTDNNNNNSSSNNNNNSSSSSSNDTVTSMPTTSATSSTTNAPIHLSMMQLPLQQQQKQQQQQQQQIFPFYASPFLDQASPVTSASSPGPIQSPLSLTGRRKGYGNTPEEAYTGVKKPFNYAEGFHYLIQYVRDKMSREDLMRISRALALFRPSFLALIMNLTEEDLVFMEKCLQRTLLEYEKLISFSGTPTVVWRRTGEICLVGKEFSLLTQWTKDMLLGKKIYIYELMDSQSAVEYWEKFSTHAFDNTDKSCVYSCIIKTPQQKPVPCTFCFTIKRDIFDLPSVIIGN
ncbi:uncharacterized protein EV154DRAFT_389213, partial [Mucor mucedo]|uniref:uncharacterized protein n=1 Tax=Mucor mucedo TaxID=29922 RepID=UPI00221EECC0